MSSLADEPIPEDLISEISYRLDDQALFRMATAQKLYPLANKLLKSNIFYWRRTEYLTGMSFDYGRDVDWKLIYYAVYQNVNLLRSSKLIWNKVYEAGMNNLDLLRVLVAVGKPIVDPFATHWKDLRQVSNLLVMRYLVENGHVVPTVDLVLELAKSVLRRVATQKVDVLIYLFSLVNLDAIPRFDLGSILILSSRCGLSELTEYLLLHHSFDSDITDQVLASAIRNNWVGIVDMLLSDSSRRQSEVASRS